MYTTEHAAPDSRPAGMQEQGGGEDRVERGKERETQGKRDNKRERERETTRERERHGVSQTKSKLGDRACGGKERERGGGGHLGEESVG